ncbi:Apolipoprotein B-100 [Galemys pyrenaicus]|uniref:Apolipoprotein B-100 n=1 Tax=Galemys pyrenaicus TaxID=202257 RepID=A0A8J6AUR2_GALPY|nr:Apolipoprotein B-100 [Galemys pyrenaicus]
MAKGDPGSRRAVRVQPSPAMGPPGPALLLPALLLLLLGAGAWARECEGQAGSGTRDQTRTGWAKPVAGVGTPAAWAWVRAGTVTGPGEAWTGEEEALETVNLSCSKDATRFKHLRKYVYNYEAEGSSEFPGTGDSRSATKINCKVELEVPQLCRFILKISQCSLREVSGFNSEGKALLKKTKNSEEFAAAMSKSELRLAIPEGKRVVLYPEQEEPKHILNIKRGIISALLVPLETEEDKQVLFLDTVYGNCSSDFVVNTRKGHVATEASIERNLRECDHFQPVSTGVSPLALIRGLSRPLSTWISSNQSCRYSLEPKRKHVSEAICQEQHHFLPFSRQNKYGMMTRVKQTLKLEDTPKINSRFFDEGTEEAGLAFESTKSTSPPKQAEAVVKTLQELQTLHVTEQNSQRANLFHKLVTELRGLDDEAVTSLLPKLIEASSPITLQALIQCGQPQCYTHILQWLKREKANPLLIDAVTYLVALIPEPSSQRLREIFNTAKEQQSRATLYALGHVINNYHKTNPMETQDLQDVADYLSEQIRNGCTGDEEHTYLILRVIGNIGRTMEQVAPRLTSSVLQCIKSTEPSLTIQKSAIQALRRMGLQDEIREVLLQTFLSEASPGDKRLAAYLMLMRDPSQSDINEITQRLPREQNEQVKNFVASHMANILKSEELSIQDLKKLVEEALKESQLPTLMDSIKVSQNYHLSKSVSLPSLDPISTKIEGNLIFDPNNYLPKESMLKTTLTVFGFAPADLFEIGLEGKGFEPTLEALFGKQGFFPDSVNKALYWVDGQVPDHVSKVLVDHFGYTKDDKREQDMVKGIMLNVQNLIKDLKSKEFPEARAYLQILGEELGFVQLQDLQLLGKMLLGSVHTLQGIPQMIGEALRKGSKYDLFLHYIFMDNTFELPTGLGFQLQVSSSGVLTPGVKAGAKLEVANMQMELVTKPSVSVEFVTNMGIVIPDFARSGIQMNTNFFHESGLEARVALKPGQLKFTIPSPKRPITLFSGSNTLQLISTTKMEALPSLVYARQFWSTCKPFFPGMDYCTVGSHSSSSSTDAAPYSPGNTRSEMLNAPPHPHHPHLLTCIWSLSWAEEIVLCDKRWCQRPSFAAVGAGLFGDQQQLESANGGHHALCNIYRFQLELKPTGEVEQYSASATYELQREGEALVDTLKFVTQAEGVQQTDATVRFRYNRQSMTLSSEIQIPDFGVDLGTILRLRDESAEEKKSYTLTLDVQNNKITEVTLTGHISCDKLKEGKIKGIISIPRLQAEARSEVLTLWSPTRRLLQMDSSATVYGSTIAKKLAWRYDDEKIEFEWNTGTNVDTKKAASNFPVDLSDYPKSMHRYANSLLDHRVPQTNMTFRHVGSKLIVAANTWLESTSRNLPYAQNLQDHLNGLKELYLQKMGSPDFHTPENLFLKSDGRVKYTWNKNSLEIEIPVPFGGKSSKDLKMIETIRMPALNLNSVGLHLPSREFQVPAFTIPKLYQLRLPLLGVLDLSTNIYSNLYNWSASYTGGNTSTNHLRLKAQYHMKASSIVDLFSYSVQGSGETTYDHRNTFTLSYDGSLNHKFVDSNIKLSHVAKFGSNPAATGVLMFDASSPWGPHMSASVHLDSKKKQHLYVKEVKMDGQFRVSSFYGQGTYGLSYHRDPATGQLNGESSLMFNSSYIQGSNHITGKYQDGTFSVISTSDLQDGIIKNTASLKYENYELALKSDTSGKYEDFVTSNKVDLTFSKQNVLLRSEYQADYRSLRFFTLISGSLDSRGLELNADSTGTDGIHSGAHKATLRIGQDGMSTSATTNLRFSPLVLENELNAALGRSGALIKLTTNGRFREHNAEFRLDGKTSLTEMSLGSAFQAMILGVNSKNIFNFKINREGLKLSNDIMGSYAEMNFDYTNHLDIAGLLLDFSSKLDNTYSTDKFYKQIFNLQLQPFVLVTTLNNDLKFNTLTLTNQGKVRLESLKLNVGGNIKGTYQDDEIKHIYTISYADLTASYKADTLARVQGAEFSHRLNTDISGLASAVDISTNYDSDSLHFNNVFRSVMAPFTMTVDAHTSADGKLGLWGDHTGQLYNKFLWKAEPLALTFTHDYKGSTSHHLLSTRSVDTVLDHKVNVLLTPAEQISTWKLKTRLNKNEYSQDLDAYNTKDKVGVEFNGQGRADLSVLDSPFQVPLLFNEPINIIDVLSMRDTVDQPQEFTIVASVKYDKNQAVHTINLPFFKILPAYFEKNRQLIITALESIQKELKLINIDQFMRNYRETLHKLPQQVNDYVDAHNWERQVSNAKEKLTALTKNYRITENDLQIALNDAKINLNEILSQLQIYVIQFDQYIKDNYDLRDFKIAVAKIIDQIIEKLKILDKHYHIRVNLVKTIHDLSLFIKKIDLNKIGSSTASWVQNMDTKYQIRIQIQEKLQQLKTQIQNIEFQHLAEKLKQQIDAIDVTVLLDRLRTTIPFQKIKEIIEHVKYCVKRLIEGFKVEKISVFTTMIHNFVKSYELDQHIQVLMDKLAQLVHQFKLTETVQRLSNALQQVEIKVHFEKLVGFIDDTVQQLKALSFQTLIEEVNKFLDMLVKKLRSFDYHQFVDETNNKIRQVTQRINGEIQAMELPQKAKALKLFLEDIQNVVSVHLENLKDTRITLLFNWLQEPLNSASLIYMKEKFQEVLEDIRDRVYQMDIQQEVQRYLSLIGQVYSTLITYISDWWSLASKNLTDFSEQYYVQALAENLKALVEQGFTVPEIQTTFGTMPAFEVSLRALQEATYQTPEFIVPLTDLKIPSVQINFRKLKDIKIPSRFSTPEFTILSTVHVPSFTIDFVEIKAKIIRTIDQMLNIFLIPNLDLKDFQVPDLHIPEFQLPHISDTIEVPTFGKLNSILKVQSSLFTLNANAKIQNVTSSEMAASITAKGESKLEILNFDFQANAQLLNPNVNPLFLKESMSFSSKYLKMEHNSQVLYLGNAIEGKSSTMAHLLTEKNALEFSNGLLVKVNNQLTLDSNTKYSHKLNIPKLEFSSQADLNHETKTLLEAGQIAWASSGLGSWKWNCPKFSDEGTHESQINFTMEGPITSFWLSNKINSKQLKVNQSLAYESGFLNFSKFEIQSQVECQYIGRSVLTAKGAALLGDRKVEITGNHNAHLNGKVIGTLKNSLFFSAQPFEITATTNNEGNLKVSFPLKLTGKIDFLNNYALLLSPSAQQVSWQASARFNQYKYYQNLSAGNNEDSIKAHIGINGEANLDFLNIPLTIPEMTLPYTTLTTPPVKDFSIWEETGLKEFLRTTKQSFDLNVKTQYKKNKDKHSISIPLDVLYVFMNNNINSFIRQFEKGRHQALVFFTNAYNEAKIKFDKYKVEKSLNNQPRTFQIPGYTIPVFNIEASPSTVKMLPFSYMIPEEISTPSFTVWNSSVFVPSYTLVLPSLELPALPVPTSPLEFSLPEFEILSTPRKILIPALGNITYEFSFKSSVITLNTNAELYNQSDIVVHFLSSSSSVVDALQYKLEGTASLTRKRGLKLAAALSLSNEFVGGSHNSTISLTKKNMEASVTTIAKVQISILNMNFSQTLNGNTKSRPTVSSSVALKYDFNSPRLYSAAAGAVDHKLSLESLTSYFSIESSTKGNIKGSVLSQKYSGMLASEASTYLNSKGARSSLKLQGASKVDGIWNLEVKENFAGEATLRRIYAIWEHSMKNHLQLEGLFLTSGEHSGKTTLELSPWEMSALVQVHASQPNSLLDIKYLGQELSLNANNKNQKVSWKTKVQVHTGSLHNSILLSNDQKEVRLDIAGSLEGYLPILKDIVLPVYDKSLWDLLKLDLTTSINRKQYLHGSTSLVYTKTPKGYAFSVPVQELADKFIIPGLNNLKLVLVTPAFQVPFTDLQLPSYTLDLSEIKIYKKLSTLPFALNLPTLPKVKFPRVDVLTKYSEPEDSSVPFFEITVPESQLTVSEFTFPKSVSVGCVVWNLNETVREIADFELPTTIMSEQTIDIPSIKFSVPAGIFLPSIGQLSAHFGVVSPLYNATWSAGLKNNANHMETFLESTASSTVQFLEYHLHVVGTHQIEEGALVCKTKGTFAHRDINAEYKGDARYQGLLDWVGEVRLDINSTTFTDVHLHYRRDEGGISSTVIGTVAMDLEVNDDILKWNVYYHPQFSPDKTLSIVKTEKYQGSEQSQIKVNWEEVSKLLNSLKHNMPKATGALYDYIDSYHEEYTGLALRDASLKLRRSLQNSAEWAYERAMRHIDDVDMRLWRVAKITSRTYQQWKDEAQSLYQKVWSQESQADFQRIQDKVFDSLVRVIHEYNTIVQRLIDRFINYLRFTRYQLPGIGGTYSGEELCTLVVREVGKVLSQVYSKIYSGLEIMLSHFHNLIEKSELVRHLKVKFALTSREMIDISLEWQKLLKSFSQSIQRALSDIQLIETTEMLNNLQRFLHHIFQKIDRQIKHLMEKKLPYLINAIQQENNRIFNKYIPYVFEFMKENLSLTFSTVNEFIQNKLQEASQELQHLRELIKSRHKEHSDPSMVNWTVKYYELEEKIISLIKNLVDVLKSFHSKYTTSTANFAFQLSSHVEQFMQKDIQEYLGIHPY